MEALSAGALSEKVQSMRRKVWGHKYGNAKCGSAKYGAQSIRAQSEVQNMGCKL